jgi:hypothetical protein
MRPSSNKIPRCNFAETIFHKCDSDDTLYELSLEAYRKNVECDVIEERVGDVRSEIGEVFDADVGEADCGRWHGETRRGRRGCDTGRRRCRRWTDVEDENGFETLNNQLRRDDDRREDPERTDEHGGTTDCVQVTGFEWPTNGVISARLRKHCCSLFNINMYPLKYVGCPYS